MTTRRSNNLVPLRRPIEEREPLEVVSPAQGIAAYLQWHVSHGSSPYTVKHERENLQAVYKHLGDIPLASITAQNIEVKVIGEMRAKNLSGNTINLRLKTLKRFFKFAVQQKIVAYDPVRQVDKVKAVASAIPSFSLEQLQRLLDQPNRATFTGLRDYTLMCLAIDTGMRLKEMLDVQVSQIDFKNRMIKDVVGKNQKLEDIPMTQFLCDKLQIYLGIRGSDLATDCLFISLQGRAMHRKTVQDRLKAYGNKAEITDVRVSPHTFRHSFAKQWILGGGDIFSLQRMLRHSTMDQVRRYVYLWGSEVQDLHDKYSPLARLQTDSRSK